MTIPVAREDDAASTAGPSSAGVAGGTSERGASPTSAAADNAAAIAVNAAAQAAALKPRDSHASAPTDIAPGSAPYWPGYQNSMLSKR